MKTEIWVPGAQLIESMRAVGYSTRTAVADIIDNSITAKSKSIQISVRSEGDSPYVAIADDGDGMTPDSARRAMQLAGTYSSSERSESDLGRFGLGLKTASLSQCKRMTLVTKSDGEVTALSWDLDYIASSQEWSLLVLDESEYSELPGYDWISGKPHGTLVLWQNLDRFGDEPERSKAIDQAMVEVGEHLSLVFHRFLAGEFPLSKVNILMNGAAIEAADPFLARSTRTQVSRQEVLVLEGQKIEIQAYTLPYLNKMSSADRRRAQLAGNIRDSQGFYVYRGGRLVIWGTWFRLMPKTDLGKLARVRVDIPNALDHLWSLDIKKSSAVPPSILKDRLRALATSMIGPSRKVHIFRGRAEVGEDPIVRPWTLVLDRDSFRYELNREHPALTALAEKLDDQALRQLEVALRIVESTFPVQDLHNRMSGDALPAQAIDNLEMLRSVLKEMWLQRATNGEDAADFVGRMMAVEPLDQLQPERISITQELEALGDRAKR